MSDYYISKITPFTKTIKGKKVKVFKFLYKGKGQTKYLRKSSKSKTELQIIRNKIEAELQNNVQIIHDAMFNDICDMAIDFRSKAVGRTVNGIRPRTFDNDKRHIRLHLTPFFGHKSIKDISTGDINNFIETCYNKNMSSKLIRHCINTLNMICKYAINEGYMVINPCSSSARNQITGVMKERGGYSHSDIKKMVDVPKDIKLQAFIMFSAFTGVSANELQGLQWQDMNFDKREIRIARTIDNRGGMQPTKNYFRQRTLGVPMGVVSILKEWKIKSKSNLWIFSNADGDKPFEQNAMRKNIKRICDMAGVQDYGIGGFRKYFNTSMIGAVPDHIRKARMGHSKFSKTAEINYTVIDLEKARSPYEMEMIFNKVFEGGAK